MNQESQQPASRQFFHAGALSKRERKRKKREEEEKRKREKRDEKE